MEAGKVGKNLDGGYTKRRKVMLITISSQSLKLGTTMNL